ncbi:hypothetical protein [Olleya sp. YS]|uniref:hypothetical protein n=1 Tax=Olleya sp. YS TaxID=3028318 RepID=UPI0024345F0F|nr:hypothetical protein [Olleya sp. YS]WGD34649.1 hypothetical protein Ollyesu_12770 [Olleya sp. YS]
MNKVYILLLLFAIMSCGNQTELQSEINQLQTQNDSLKSELKKYENKYVFDDVKIKHFPIKGSQVKKGTKYYGEFVFVPDVRDDFVLFGTERDESKQGYEIKNPITLKTEKGDFGAYRFEVDIVSDTTNLMFKPLIKNKLSLKHQNAGYSGIMISDKLIAN